MPFRPPVGGTQAYETCDAASALQMAVEPVEDDLEPLHAVCGRPGAGQLVALGREPNHLDVVLAQPERDEQVFALLDRAAEVVLGVDDQERRRDLLRVA